MLSPRSLRFSSPTRSSTSLLTIMAWLREAPRSLKEIDDKYPPEGTDNKSAKRLLTLCKDPFFVNGTIDWSEEQLGRLYYLQVENDFPDFQTLKSFLSASRTSKLRSGPGSGMFTIETEGPSIDQIFRFVISDKCETIEDIKDRYEGAPAEAAARRMFAVFKGEDIEGLFLNAKKHWNALMLSPETRQHAEELRAAVTKAHGENPFKDRKAVDDFVKMSQTSFVKPKQRAGTEYLALR